MCWLDQSRPWAAIACCSLIFSAEFAALAILVCTSAASLAMRARLALCVAAWAARTAYIAMVTDAAVMAIIAAAAITAWRMVRRCWRTSDPINSSFATPCTGAAISAI